MITNHKKGYEHIYFCRYYFWYFPLLFVDLDFHFTSFSACKIALNIAYTMELQGINFFRLYVWENFYLSFLKSMVIGIEFWIDKLLKSWFTVLKNLTCSKRVLGYALSNQEVIFKPLEYPIR